MADAKRRFLLPDQLQQFEDSVRVICVRVRDNNGIKSGNAALFQIRENPFFPWPTSSAVMENVSRGR